MSTITKEQLIEDLKASTQNSSGMFEIGEETICALMSLLTAPRAPVVPAELHPDTQKLVTDFCSALAEKLYKAQLKYGYDADWKQDGWHTQCQAHFHQHIAKGDPRDVAAYCAFMWFHGWKTEPAPVSVPDDVMAAIQKVARIRLDLNDFDGDKRGILDCLSEAEEALIEVVNRRAAMLQGAEPVSNRDELPLDYLQGLKDGLEWAAQLAEANHPHTGDWLYDDPLELAKSIRKGPDMLEPDGNSPVIPDGWVMVPVEPTEHMIVEGFESEPDEFFSDEEVWEAYDAMSGCQQAAHRAKLCWAAMIAAAPKLE